MALHSPMHDLSLYAIYLKAQVDDSSLYTRLLNTPMHDLSLYAIYLKAQVSRAEPSRAQPSRVRGEPRGRGAEQPTPKSLVYIDKSSTGGSKSFVYIDKSSNGGSQSFVFIDKSSTGGSKSIVYIDKSSTGGSPDCPESLEKHECFEQNDGFSNLLEAFV